MQFGPWPLCRQRLLHNSTETQHTDGMLLLLAASSPLHSTDALRSTDARQAAPVCPYRWSCCKGGQSCQCEPSCLLLCLIFALQLGLGHLFAAYHTHLLWPELIFVLAAVQDQDDQPRDAGDNMKVEDADAAA